MPVGVQIRSAGSVVVFDTVDGVSRILGSVWATVWDGSAPIPSGGTGARLFAFWAGNDFGNFPGAAEWPQLWVSGGLVYWQRLYTTPPPWEAPREIIVGECTR